MNFKELRKEKGFTKKSLARALGVSVKKIEKWQDGKKKPSKRCRKLLSLDLIVPQGVYASTAEELRQIQIAELLTRRELASRLDVSPREIENIVTGKAFPHASLVRRITELKKETKKRH